MKNPILKLFAATLFMLFSGSAFAEKRIYLCQDYNAKGDAIGISSTWNIKPSGGNIYILYKNDGVNFKAGNLSIYIDKKSGSSYTAFDTRVVTPNKFMSWLVYDHKFTSAGDYKVSIVDGSGAYLATEYFSVQITGTTESATGLYKNSSVNVTTGVDDTGTPYSIVSELTRVNGSVTGTVLIKNPDGFKSNELVVDIYIGEGTDGFVHTKRYTVDPSWTWFRFDYTFYVDGKFRFVVHNKENKYINTGWVNISK